MALELHLSGTNPSECQLNPLKQTSVKCHSVYKHPLPGKRTSNAGCRMNITFQPDCGNTFLVLKPEYARQTSQYHASLHSASSCRHTIISYVGLSTSFFLNDELGDRGRHKGCGLRSTVTFELNLFIPVLSTNFWHQMLISSTCASPCSRNLSNCKFIFVFDGQFGT